ncbi:MAG: GntR family transcriptional regulator [Clostridia bacterium]|nr:GntR family transcriptional regulator [Clostridia bacterium]
MKHKTVSLADQVFERLESEIICGKYQRGQVLTELGLTEDLGVSRTPVREAVQRLEQEQLVRNLPKGILVLGVTDRDIQEIYTIRLRIEGLAAARAAENRDEDGVRALAEALAMQEYFVFKQDADHIKSQDSLFHEAVYEMSGSGILQATLLPLHRKVQKYRQISMQSEERAKRSLEEHRAIYEAICKGDAELAEKLMTAHIEHAMVRLFAEQLGSPKSE